MRKSLLLAVAAVALSSACYRVTVLSGAPEAPTPAVMVPWANGFIYGLVPPPTVNTNAQCTQGVAKVVTEQSLVNSLAALVTFSLYTPMQIAVTCATGPVRSASAALPSVGLALQPAAPAAPAAAAAPAAR
jgi:hypothetical protein